MPFLGGILGAIYRHFAKLGFARFFAYEKVQALQRLALAHEDQEPLAELHQDRPELRHDNGRNQAKLIGRMLQFNRCLAVHEGAYFFMVAANSAKLVRSTPTICVVSFNPSPCRSVLTFS